MDFADKTLLLFGVVACAGLLIVGLVTISAQRAIATDKVFKVTSDTSKYSCVISEVDEDLSLSLNCLQVK